MLSPDLSSVKTDTGDWMKGGGREVAGAGQRTGQAEDSGEEEQEGGDGRRESGSGRRMLDGSRRTKSLESKIGLMCHPKGKGVRLPGKREWF